MISLNEIMTDIQIIKDILTLLFLVIAIYINMKIANLEIQIRKEMACLKERLAKLEMFISNCLNCKK